MTENATPEIATKLDTTKLIAFATTIGVFLDTNCVGSIAVPRPRLAEVAGLDPKKHANLISEMVSAGLLPGYKMRPGAAGGVCRLDAAELTAADKVDPAFVTLLNSTLALLVPALGQGSTTRSRLAIEMNKANPEIPPTSETENRISACLGGKLCPGYMSQRGRGIFRVNETETVEEAVSCDAAEGAIEPPSGEPTAEAAPETVAEVVVEPELETAPEVKAPTKKKASKKSKK